MSDKTGKWFSERAEEIRTGVPQTRLLACRLCGVLLWDIEAHYAHAHSGTSDKSEVG